MIGFEISLNGIKPIERQKRERKKGKSLLSFPDNYCVVDIETTGLDSEFDNIIEISAVKISENEVRNTYTSLVNISPEVLWDYITQLTGITNEMLKNSPKLTEVLRDFISFVGNDTVVGHNVNFDINFLYDSIISNFDSVFSNNYVDTMRLSRKLLPDLQHHRLKDLALYYNIDYTKAHRGLEDCMITYKVFNSLKQEAINKYGSCENFNKNMKQKLRPDLTALTAEKTDFDTDNPLYDKVCVFTGKLENLTRNEAAQLVVNVGGKCENSINAKTDYLILGNMDYAKNVKEGATNKFKKAQSLKLKGSPIEIITENVFYDMLAYKGENEIIK